MTTDLPIWQAFFKDRVKRHHLILDGYYEFLERCYLNSVPPIFEERHLSLLIGLDYDELAGLLNARPGRYRVFTIPKRKGGRREINVPSPELMSVQRWILKEVLYALPISDYAHGGVPGRSIFTNAAKHVGQRAVLRMDLANYFGTIKIASGIAVFQSAGYSKSLCRSLGLLCFENGQLPQGAPTSSALANIISRQMDARLAALSASFGLTYTRYVDDLTFSGRSIGAGFAEIISDIVRQSGFVVNPEKTALMRGRSPKYVTGLSVGGDRIRVPRQFKRSLKNEAFQIANRGVDLHMQETGNRDPLILETVLGRLAFWLQAEPTSTTAIALFHKLKSLRREKMADASLPEPIRPQPLDTAIHGQMDVRSEDHSAS